jgi:hypothetical protein
LLLTSSALSAGNMVDGPWTYRIGSVLFVTPVYSLLLLFFGTVSGKHAYFIKVARRMWARLLPFLFRKPAGS